MNNEPFLHVVLHQPEIPHNTGNIGRTCVAIGAKLWLVRPLGFRLDDHYLRRAGLDYWQHLEWEAVDDWSQMLSRLPPEHYWFFSKTGRQLYTAARYQRGDVLVFGGETRGLPAGLLIEYQQRVVKLPMRPEARSLNLANAVAVAAYEAVRQTQL